MIKRQKYALKSARIYVTILGVMLDSTSVDKVLNTIGSFLQSGYKFRLFTPNSEMLVEADLNKNFKKILNSSDINVPDTVGLAYASKFLFGKPLTIIPGRKLFLKLIQKAFENNWKIFLLGGLGNEVLLTKEKLEKTYRGLTIKCLKGPVLAKNGQPLTKTDEKEEREAVNTINKYHPDILFVGFGHPKQETWITTWLPKLNCGGAMGVGGTFSYISGKSKLPPEWVGNIGLEWLWRLIHEPRRVLRIINAVIVFPLKVIGNKFGLN